MSPIAGMTEPLRLDLLRHGEPEGGGGRFRGRRDDPLSGQGEAQMAAALADLAQWEGPPWDVILSSPLRRCRLPAERLAEARGLPLHLVPEWTEMDFGAWEGQTVAAVHARSPRALADFWRDPWRHPPPGGEPLPRFFRRVLTAWERLCAHPPGRRWLVFTHGGVMRLLLMSWLDLPSSALWAWRLDHAARLRLSWPPPTLLRYEGEAP